WVLGDQASAVSRQPSAVSRQATGPPATGSLVIGDRLGCRIPDRVGTQSVRLCIRASGWLMAET
ncbi:MAG: hypothetical protein C4346_16880, partial [Chloroflexota bacterium]